MSNSDLGYNMSTFCQTCQKSFYSKQTKTKHDQRYHANDGDQKLERDKMARNAMLQNLLGDQRGSGLFPGNQEDSPPPSDDGNSNGGESYESTDDEEGSNNSNDDVSSDENNELETEKDANATLF
ncbi:MAG: hypothetical protein GY804_11940, partial [Alphaproteobacteria bacterium]|nr:hypothetical protein [Alphaproteobacteria bacterium]